MINLQRIIDRTLKEIIKESETKYNYEVSDTFKNDFLKTCISDGYKKTYQEVLSIYSKKFEKTYAIISIIKNSKDKKKSLYFLTKEIFSYPNKTPFDLMINMVLFKRELLITKASNDQTFFYEKLLDFYAIWFYLAQTREGDEAIDHKIDSFANQYNLKRNDIVELKMEETFFLSNEEDLEFVFLMQIEIRSTGVLNFVPCDFILKHKIFCDKDTKYEYCQENFKEHFNLTGDYKESYKKYGLHKQYCDYVEKNYNLKEDYIQNGDYYAPKNEYLAIKRDYDREMKKEMK